jgi:hypothetical protein
MIPAHSVSMLFTLPFTPRCLFQWSHTCAPTLQLRPRTSSVFRMTGFPALFAMTITARSLRSRSRPSSLFEPFLHTPRPQFLIQNTQSLSAASINRLYR